MGLRVRRVVTGHSAQGKAVVAIDETMTSAPSARPGQEACVVWATDRVPADNLDPADGALRTGTTTLANGAIFRVVRYAAGMTGRMHRTRTLDYGVVLGGSIVLVLDDAAEVTLHAGDVLVQRGTIHNWVNRGTEPCTIAFVLVDAAPVTNG
jgi:quercetin dioxygenase-like cupin family protein